MRAFFRSCLFISMLKIMLAAIVVGVIVYIFRT